MPARPYMERFARPRTPAGLTCRRLWIPSLSPRLAFCNTHTGAAAASSGGSILTRLRPNNLVSGE
jgi:hypothetical protein